MPSRPIDRVIPGHYRVRLVRRGPWVAATIEIRDGTIWISEGDREPRYGCTVAEYLDLVVEHTAEGNAFRHPVLRISWFGEPISARDHAHLVRMERWASENRRDHPAASPKQPIDMGTVPIDLIV